MISNRPTALDDIEFLWHMLYYASHSDEEPDVEPEDVRSNPDLIGYIEGWKSIDHLGVIAESQDVPLGAAWLRLLGPADQTNPVFVDWDTPELAVAVEPGYEGRGMGSSMITDLLAMAKGNYPAVVLSARGDNPAVRLYQRLGFEVVATITNRVGTGSVKMLRRL